MTQAKNGGAIEMERRSHPALLPLVLRVTGVQAVAVRGRPSDEDALPTVVELDNDGLLLSQGTRLTAVSSETTDDA